MQVYHSWKDFPISCQKQLKEGFNTQNLKDFYPTSTNFWMYLLGTVLLGIPGFIASIWGVIAIVDLLFFQDNFSDSSSISDTIVLVVAVLIVLILLIAFFIWGINLFTNFMRAIQIKQGHKKQRVYFGLWLATDALIYRPRLANKKPIYISKKQVTKAEWHSEILPSGSGGGKHQVYFSLIYYHDSVQNVEYHIRIDQEALDAQYLQQREVYQIVNDWLTKKGKRRH